MYIFIVFLITVKIYPSTFLLFYMSTDVPVHHYTCSVYVLFFGVTCHNVLSTRLLGYLQTYPPEKECTCLPSCFSLVYNEYLPVSTTTSVPAHRCTRSWPYLFILIQSFWYPLSSTRPRFCCSTLPQTYMFINIPVWFISYFPAYPTQRPFSSSTGVLPTDPPENKCTCLPSCFSFV